MSGQFGGEWGEDGGGSPRQELIPPSAAAMIMKTQIDVAVSTARAYPRSAQQFQRQLIDYIRMDESIAEECMYRLERKSKGRNGAQDETKIISGPSIRFAELVAAAWGHLRVEGHIVDEGKQFITVSGSCHDLFSNNFFSSEIARRITTASGSRYGADMIMVTTQAASAIAIRNAILRVIPQPLWRPAFQAATQAAMGDDAQIPIKRVRMVGQFALLGVTPPMLLAKVQREKIDDIGRDDLVRLFGILTSLREDQTTIDAEFGAGEQETARPSGNPLSAREDTGDDEGAGDQRTGAGNRQGGTRDVPLPSNDRRDDDGAQARGTVGGVLSGSSSPADETRGEARRGAGRPPGARNKPKETPAPAQAASPPAATEPAAGIREQPEDRQESVAETPSVDPKPPVDFLVELGSAVAEAKTRDELSSVHTHYRELIDRLQDGSKDSNWVADLFTARHKALAPPATTGASNLGQEGPPPREQAPQPMPAKGEISPADWETFKEFAPDDGRFLPLFKQMLGIWLSCTSVAEIAEKHCREMIAKLDEDSASAATRARYMIKKRIETASTASA